MSAITAKRLAIVIAVLGMVGGAGFFTRQYQVNRMGRNELEKARLAVKKGEFITAMTLLGDRLRVIPNEPEVQIEYAAALLKASRSLAAQSEAVGIYNEILKKTEREDVRRLLLQLKFDMGHLNSRRGGDDGADVDLTILLQTPANQNDGHLWYLMGRCYEAQGDDPRTVETAVENYQKAIEHKAPEQALAGERLAGLLREKLKRPKEARDVIDKLVKDNEKDYRVYLARGRFLLGLAARDPSPKPLEAAAQADFDTAEKLEPKAPEVYLQRAAVALGKGKSGYSEARQILADGLMKASGSKAIYLELANLEIRTGNNTKAAIDGSDLRLMSPLKDATDIPTKGKT